MIRNKTLHAAARVLLGAFIAAYAMSSVHVYAGVAKASGSPSAPAAHHAMPPVQTSSSAVHQYHGAMPEAGAEMENMNMERTDSHCQPRAVDPAILLCKFHCQNAVQTLDHPSVMLPDLAPVLALLIPHADLDIPRKPLVAKAFRPEAAHHGGAPPLYYCTARLRI